jgi:hypothetical protein
MPNLCLKCSGKAHVIGDNYLCNTCTIRLYFASRGNQHRCGNGSKCLRQKSKESNRQWLKPGRSNYQIQYNGTIVFHRYCCSCYHDWSDKVNKSEKFLAKNAKLEKRVAQLENVIQKQNELIRWMSPVKNIKRCDPEILNYFSNYQ